MEDGNFFRYGGDAMSILPCDVRSSGETRTKRLVVGLLEISSARALVPIELSQT